MTRTKVAGVVNISADGDVLTVATNVTTPPKGRKKKNQTAKSPLKFLDPDTNSPCRLCNKAVDSSPKSEAIECDRCASWVHFNCSKISREDYDFLSNNPLTQVLWFCKRCKDELKECENGQIDRIAQQGAKIDTFMNIITKMNTEMTDLKNQMTKVVENTTQVVGDEAKQIESKADMKIHVSESIEDQQEKNEKKNSVIMFNVPEAVESNDKTEMEDDLTIVKEIISIVHPNIENVSLSDKNVVRLGGRKPGKVRPVKIQFKEDFTKGRVFKNSAKLRNHEKYSKVNISNDKTKKELMADKELKDKLEFQRLSRPQDDLIIYRGDIIKRSLRQELEAERKKRPQDDLIIFRSQIIKRKDLALKA